MWESDAVKKVCAKCDQNDKLWDPDIAQGCAVSEVKATTWGSDMEAPDSARGCGCATRVVTV